MGHRGECSPCFPRLAAREVAGLLLLAMTHGIWEQQNLPLQGTLCSDTYPAMDVSTSCTSGTSSVSMLSCRASERSMFPLCGEGRRKGQWSVQAALSCLPVPHHTSSLTSSRLTFSVPVLFVVENPCTEACTKMSGKRYTWEATPGNTNR